MTKTKQQRIEEMYEKASMLRADANDADERGQAKKAERLYARSIQWVHKIRVMEGAWEAGE
jgi:hypothetical protein